MMRIRSLPPVVLLLLFPLLYFASADDLQQLLSFRSSLPNPGLLDSWRPERGGPCGGGAAGVSCHGGAVVAISLEGIPLAAGFDAVASLLLSLPGLQALSLRSTGLTGALSTVRRCSGRLEDLNLAGNEVSGSVSDVFSLAKSCSRLRSFNVSGNWVGSGDGASSSSSLSLYGHRLETLDLSGNRISGGFGVELEGALSSGVQVLKLAGNRISGSFPAILNCTSLEELDLSSNSFSGKLPAGALSACTELSFLNISSNDFSGVLPSDLPSSLAVLSLGNNNFSGELPVEDFAAMPGLKMLDLAFNSISGELPVALSRLTGLQLLDLSSNALSGSIPTGLCGSSGTSLRELYLQNNRFSGPLPASICNCSKLVSLDVSFNFLTGDIPASIGSLPELRDLIMWQNLLEGPIPPELGLIPMLENLIIDNNGLTGTIPDRLINCSKLNWISLSSNHLSGPIPSWIGRLDNLAILKLGNNSFSGPIPVQLGDCKSLIWLDLNSNRLNGSLPSSLARQSGNIAAGLVTGKRYVYLKSDGSSECHGAGNLLEFAGIRPEQLSHLPSRRSCNFTRVYMGNTQYTFNHNGSMIFLDLSYNELSGEIPREIGRMYYLMILNLGHNYLSGVIPRDLGLMRYVAVLDLSHNALEGPIPNSFSGLSMLSEIDLSSNKLNGSIPELGSLATFPRYRYENNSGLCGFPLPACDGKSSSESVEQLQKPHRSRPSLGTSVVLGLLLSLLCIVAWIFYWADRQKKKKKDALGSTRDIPESRSHSGTVASAWKFTSTKEALSINLVTTEKPLLNLTFADLLEATNGFHANALIGSGGFGDVYKAQLKDSCVVAIKKLIHVSGQGDREFMAEMETIGKIKHRNLVPLLGYCKVGEERLLVYECMKYGSLEDVLHNRKKAGMKLNWAVRRKIAIGAARGLAFLHHNCIPHIIHRDMKSSNVLLDEHLEPRVSDFGMARLMSALDTHLSVSTLAGTPGYVPPEYYQSFRCTTKGDVYSYGVVLLELLTGKQPTDSSDFGDNNLVGWVKQHTKLRISDVFDPELLKEDPGLELELLEHLKIACSCLDDRPLRRPTMLKVMAMFKEIQAGSTVGSTPSLAALSVDGSFGVIDMSLNEDGKEDRD